MKRVTVVGLGPGKKEQMTIEADKALRESDVIVGYTVYVDLIKDEYKGKKFLSTPMRQEVERCKIAVEEALAGSNVAMVCSGDSGVYGMAGLIYQVAQKMEPVQIRVIPGITAACSGGSILGAPITHDFAVISLSDLLTPWEIIEKRLRCAAEGQLAICLYNPSSKKRKDYLKRACDILLEYMSEETVCGIAVNIGREGERGQILPLLKLRNTEVDMFTTIFIGNPNTFEIEGKMVTPRGYLLEKKKEKI